MRPTKYNSRITIQTLTRTENEINGWSNSWTELFTSWASVSPVKGYKRLEYQKLEYDEIFEVELRSRLVNPDGDCRVIYGGLEYQIISTPLVSNGRVTFDIGRTAE